ncbi:MAG: EamA family transporter RarD, partial [Sphingomicrobium sp.]
MNAPTAPDPHGAARRGLGYGLAAYGLWGVLPIYFKLVAAIPAIDIVAHRILWSLPFLALLLWIGRGWGEFARAFARRRTLALLAVTA